MAFTMVLAVLLVGTMTSCEDEQIEWETEEIAKKLVVEGTLTNQYQHHQVHLSTSADYFSNEKTPRVSGATVTLMSSSDTIVYQEDPNQKGLYAPPKPFAGKPGQTYTLDIELKNPINQQTHYQATEKMHPGLVLDTIQASTYRNPLYVEDAPMDSLILYLTAYGEEPKNIRNYYLVNLYRNHQALMDTIEEQEIYSDSQELEGQGVYNFFFFKSFQPGDTVGLKISTVSDAYRRYLKGIKNIVNQSGNPFDLSGPPANAVGNIQGGEALGYFRVSHVTHSSTIVKSGE